MRTTSKAIWLCLSAQILLSGVAVSQVQAAPGNVQNHTAKAVAAAMLPKTTVQVSGPFCNDNLAIYLIRGPQKIKGTVLTLERGAC